MHGMQSQGESHPRGGEPRLHLPYITILVIFLVPAVTFAYTIILHGMGSSHLVMWVTSPFNIFYEEASNGIIYNYVLLVIIFAFVESYSRYMADIRERDSLVDHAFLFSIIASYIAAAAVWVILGVPAVGTSVLSFCMLLFFVSETTDSELINRLRERHQRKGYHAEVLTFAYAALLMGISVIFFAYINSNQYWYIHLMGGAIFGITFFIYTLHRLVNEQSVSNKKATVKSIVVS